MGRERARRGAALLQRLRQRGVAAAAALDADPRVDRVAHEQVAEAAAQVAVVERDDAGRDQLVECGVGVGRVDAAGARGQLDVERVAGERGAVEQRAGLLAEVAQRALDGRLDRARQRLAAPAGARQLEQEEGIAARLRQQLGGVGGGGGGAARAGARALARAVVAAVAARRSCAAVVGDGVDRGVAQQRAGVGVGERAELERDSLRQVARRLRDRLRGGARARRQQQQDAGVGRVAQQVQQQLQPGRVGPVEVVEREHQRRPPGERGDQRADGAMEAEAGIGAQRQVGVVAVAAAQGGQQPPQLAAAGGAEAVERGRRERLDGVVEQLDPEAVGDVALERGGARPQHADPRLLGLGGDRAGDRRLADPRLADQLQRRRAAAANRAQHLLSCGQLACPSRQRRCRLQLTTDHLPHATGPGEGDR